MKRLIASTLLAMGIVAAPVLAGAEEAKAPATEAKAEPAKKDEKAAEAPKADDKESAFAAALRKQNPEAHAKFVEIRARRKKLMKQLKTLAKTIRKAPSVEKINLFQEYKQARINYDKASLEWLALLDGLDEKNLANLRIGLERIQKRIAHIKGIMAKRAEARKTVEKDLEKVTNQ